MNRKIIAISVAVLLAVLGTTAVLLYVNSADSRALAGQEARTVLVATETIPEGTSAAVARASLRAERMPVSSIPRDALTQLDKSDQKLVTSTNMAPGQLLTRRLLVTQSQKGAIALPKGKLAISIPVNGAEQTGAELKPGFQVALFNSFTVGGKKGGYTPDGSSVKTLGGTDQATRLLLPRVDVISIIRDKKNDDGGNLGKFMVTVAVDQKDAEKLIHALATGLVSIAQINDDSHVSETGGTDTAHLFTPSNEDGA